MSILKSPVKLNFEDTTDNEERFNKIVYAVNTNGNEVNKALKSLDFENNFNAFVTTKTVVNGDTHTFRHNLGYKPTIWIVHNDSRVDRVEQVSVTAKQLQLVVYHKSTFLTAAVSGSKEMYVANPFLFKVGDTLLVDTDEREITDIDTTSRKITVDLVTTQSQFDSVVLKTEEVSILIM